MKEELQVQVATVQVVTVAQALDTFLYRGLANVSPDTYRWYAFRLQQFVAELGDKPLSDVMEGDLLDWYAALKKSNLRYASGKSDRPPVEGTLSIHTLHGYVRAVKRLFAWLKEKHILEDDPSAGLELPKLPKGGHEGIATPDALKMLRVAEENIRDYALLMFFYSTGCRLGGAENLLLSDLRLEEPEPFCRRVTIREKGSKARTVFLTVEARVALLTWLRHREDVDDPHVFLGQKNGMASAALTEWGIREVFKRTAEKAGVTQRWGPHEWRHNFARRKLESGMSLASVSQILGHEDVSITVKFYGQFAVAQLQEQFDRFG